MIELYRRIWVVTGRQQIILIILSLLVAALAAVPLQFQKGIINGLSESMQMQQMLTSPLVTNEKQTQRVFINAIQQ